MILSFYLFCFPFHQVQTDNSIVIYEENDRTREILVFEYPQKEERLIEVVESEHVEGREKERDQVIRSIFNHYKNRQNFDGYSY